MRFLVTCATFIIFSNLLLATNFPVTAKYGDISNITNTAKTTASPDIPGWLVVDIGFNFLIDENPAMSRKFFGSKSFGIYYMKAFELGKKLDFNLSFGIASEKFAFGEDIALAFNQINATGPQNLTLDSLGFAPDVNKLAITYVDMPFEFRFYPSKKTGKNSYFLALGGALGVKLSSHTKIKRTIDDRTFTTKVKENYNLSGVRYGVSARAGWRGFSVYYKQYFSPFFTTGDEPVGTIEEPRNSVFGISLSLF
jgi:hypothetical protein